MIIHVKNLRARTIIGTNEWERNTKQDVIINLKLEFDGTRAAETDKLEHTVDYEKIKNRIIDQVEQTNFMLVEKLADYILKIAMQDPLVEKATVEVDKPRALRYADSVSISASASREK